MIVAFPFAFGGSEDSSHVAQADLFVHLMRKFQPRYSIVQLSDRKTRSVSGVDGIFRIDVDPFGMWFFAVMSAFPADQFLRLDYDVVVRDDVSDVFTEDFDIAVSEEDEMMNNGVVFVKSKDIFATAMEHYLCDTAKNNWEDIQLAMSMAMRKYNVLKLPRDVYNYRQSAELADYPKTARVLHFKGGKKMAMARDFA